MLRGKGLRWAARARVVWAFVLAFLVLGEASVLGQGLYRLPSRREERGIRLGAFRVWPELFFETRYDSNLFRKSSKDAGDMPSAVIFRLNPALEVRNASRIVKLHFDGAGDFRFYMGSGASSVVVESQKKAGGVVRSKVTLFPESIVHAYVKGDLTRALQSRNEVSRETYTRFVYRGGGGIVVQPGGAFSLDVSYLFSRDTFEEVELFNQSSHRFLLRTRWDFFPRTHAFLTGDYRLNHYDNRRYDVYGQDQIGNFDSKPLRVYLGVNGYITSRLFATVAGGYGGQFAEGGPSYNGFVAKALLGYDIGDFFVVQTGYQRLFSESLFGNYYAQDAVVLATQLRLWQMVDLDVQGKFAFVNYGSAPETDTLKYSDPERSDKLLSVKAGLALDFTRYLGVNAGVEYTNLMSDFYTYGVDGGAETWRDYGAFTKLEVYGNVVVRY